MSTLTLNLSFSFSPKQFHMMVPSLPEEIMIEILLRLEVKPLARFKSVGKKWYNLIEDPEFISRHHNLSKASQLLIGSTTRPSNDSYKDVFSFRSNDKSARLLSPDLDIPGGQDDALGVVGSCNGIVCYFHFLSGEVFLSNPVMREFKQLPSTSIHPGRDDHELSLIGVAFGHDSRNIYDFKVLRVFSVSDKRLPRNDVEATRAEMFTLSSKAWKQLDWGLDKRLSLIGDVAHGLFCADAFHFIAGLERGGPGGLRIVRCDIHTERFTTIDFPKTGERGLFYSILRYKDFLAAVFRPIGVKPGEKYIDIWIMKEHGVVESWTKLYRVKPLGLARPICFWMDDQALLLWQLEDRVLVTCDLNTLSLERMEIDGYTTHSETVIHKESLVSIM